jgi:hypothetical protein
MNQFRVLASAAVLAAAAAAGAAMGQSVNLDGSVSTNSDSKASLAGVAASSLQRANVPSTKTAPIDVKAAADADIKKRNNRPRLKAERENLKGDDAKRAIAEQQNPSTYDRSIQNGDIDHTEQVTDLKVTIKK